MEALTILYYGTQCRRDELPKIKTDDIEDVKSPLIVKVHHRCSQLFKMKITSLLL